MLLVVLYHSCVFWTGGWFTAVSINQPSSILQIFPNWLNSFHIYGFTLISGFIFAHQQSYSHYKNFKSFVEKKIKRLIIPYVFICVFWIIPITQIFYHYSIMILIRRYFMGIAPSQLWFLLMLFDVFILSWISEPLYKKDIFSAVVISIFSYALGKVGEDLLPNIYQIWYGFQYLSVFILGYNLYHSDKKRRPIAWILLHTVTFILIYIMPTGGLFIKVFRGTLGFLNHLFGALMAFTVLEWLAEKVNYQKSSAFKALSKHSMTIYLFHQQIIYLIIWYMNERVNIVFIAAFNFFISLVLSLLISVILSKWRLTRFLVGDN